MAERFPRNATDPIAVALALALQEIAQRRYEERAAAADEGRRTMRAADGTITNGGAHGNHR